jgi:sugar (pentulose or hexulose) kinase
MSQSRYILAHDLGTTGNKAILFDAAGATVATTFGAYGTAYPHPNWAEQDPADWWREGERPNPAHNQRYTALYSLFQQTYTALEPIFEQLATLAK